MAQPVEVLRPSKDEFCLPFCDYVRTGAQPGRVCCRLDLQAVLTPPWCAVCREHPGFAAVKVVPPKVSPTAAAGRASAAASQPAGRPTSGCGVQGWRPRATALPDLADVEIQTPVLQHVSVRLRALQDGRAWPAAMRLTERPTAQMNGQGGVFRAALEEQRVRALRCTQASGMRARATNRA